MAASATDRTHSSKQQHRRRLLSHLHIQVPVPASSGWSGSGPASAPSGDAHASAHHHHQDRPASPSLLRSPTAWIRSKGHGLGSSKHHTPRRPGNGNFHYDARSYAQNFDDGGREEDEYALKHRLLMSPHQVSPSPSPSNQGTSGGGSSSNGEEPARETLRVME